MMFTMRQMKLNSTEKFLVVIPHSPQNSSRFFKSLHYCTISNKIVLNFGLFLEQKTDPLHTQDCVEFFISMSKVLMVRIVAIQDASLNVPSINYYQTPPCEKL